MIMTMKMLKHLKRDKIGQTSVEVILLIGSILVIAIICGTYIYRINSQINDSFNQTLDKGRLYLLNKLN
ncbi:class III signal peptide-containing protein [Methanobrevibacter sp.]|uniref:class III signal peptide-containing protein n=1 Tax=Methanobrevibacter sp. TaxID=66852 RepID=UPI00388EE085